MHAKKGAPESGSSCGRRWSCGNSGAGEKTKFRPRASDRLTKIWRTQPGYLLLRWLLAVRSGARPCARAAFTPLAHPGLFVGAHLVKALLLIVVQHALDLRVGALPQRLHLGHPIFARQGRVAVDRFHLFALIFQNRLEFGLLVRAQVELLAQVFNLIVNTHHGTMAHASHALTLTHTLTLTLSLTLRGRRGALILGKCSAEAEQSHQKRCGHD